MQLTKKAGYGLIAVLELAASSGEGPITAAAISEKYKLPIAFVGKILHQLKNAGLVSAQQGRGGGYEFSKDSCEVSLRQVLEALDESLDLVGCININSDCWLASVCPTKTMWRDLDSKFKDLLESLSLRDIIAIGHHQDVQGLSRG